VDSKLSYMMSGSSTILDSC